MRHALERLPYDRLVPAAIAAAVVAFACGSSSVHALNAAGKPARWVLLLALLAVATGWAWSRGFRRPATPVAAGAAVAFVAVAITSAAWSVAPRLSFERGVSIALVFAAAALLASAGDAERVLTGVVAGGAAVAVAGLVLLAVDRSAAVSPASYEVPSRYQGLGENPNTAALLLSLALPIALAGAVALREPRRRLGAAACAALFLGSIVASGSRGGLAAAAAGALVVAAGAFRGRRAIVAVAAVVTVGAAAAYVESIPKPLPITPPSPAALAAARRKPAPKPPRYFNVDKSYPLDADVGGPLPGGGQPNLRRTFFASSGRLEAWRGALAQAAQRPLLGFGFGTEGRVFVDRYYYFVGGLVENAYIGLALQIGLVGLATLAVLVVALAAAGIRALARRRAWTTLAALAVLAAGLVDAVAQSYFYSAGDIATLALWTCVFLLAVHAREVRE